MSEPAPPERATLVFGLLRSPEILAEEVLAALADAFGPVCAISPWLPFTQTTYYVREMGPSLERAFACVEGLRYPGDLAALKGCANALERRWSAAAGRRVNIDPGLVDLTHLVLATGKPGAHRLYLGQGIYGEVEYVFEHGTFRSLPWTYPDYREAPAVQFFNSVRATHRERRAQCAAPPAVPRDPRQRIERP